MHQKSAAYALKLKLHFNCSVPGARESRVSVPEFTGMKGTGMDALPWRYLAV